MKKFTKIFIFIALIATIILSQKVFGQTYVPITNNHNGISIGIQGTLGSDYIFDRYYFDPLINDCGLCYIKSDVDITLAHNANNSRPHQRTTVIIGGDEGNIRYKVDRDWQEMYWAGDDYTDPVAPDYNDNWKYYPEYTGPVSFDDMEYETGVSVVGTLGFNPGYPITDRQNSYPRGMLDLAGNEYHYLTYADDDDHDTDGGFRVEKCASDGKSMLFCINPKTPAIWLSTTSSGAQYYTTPAKVHWVPKIHEQISYVTDNVDINLANIMNSNIVYYRIDGGNYQAYTGAISSNILSDGEHILEFYYNSTDVQTRKIIKNPDHPSKNEVSEDGVGHGYLLWKDDADFLRWKERVTNGYWKDMFTQRKNEIAIELPWPANNGIRNPDISHNSNALMLALVALAEGVASNLNYMDGALTYLLNNPRMHIENIGWEGIHASTPQPSDEIAFRGYYDDIVLWQNAFMYDIIAAHYRSDQFPGGMTPIEDYRLRDMIALPAHEGLLYLGGYRNWQNPYPNSNPLEQMWPTARQRAAVGAALAMPSYDTPYYGTSGFDGTQAQHLWTPYPDNPESWKDVYFTYTDYKNSNHVNRLANFPNRTQLFNWFDGTLYKGLIRSDGTWHDRVPYCSHDLNGHGLEYFYNIMKRKFDKTYPNLDLFMYKSSTGTMEGHKFKPDTDYGLHGYPRCNMTNEYFPHLAHVTDSAYDYDDPDAKYFYTTNPYGFVFYNPNWRDDVSCKSTIPPTTPSNLTGISRPTSVDLSWDTSNHMDCGVIGYRIKRDGVVIAVVASTNYTDTRLTSGTQYEYAVAAISKGGILSNYSSSIQLTTMQPFQNIALNKGVIASAEPQPDYSGDKITDGDISNTSRWSSTPFPQWAEIDLGSNHDIYSTAVYTYYNRDFQFIIEAKPEGGSTYTTIVDRSDNAEESSGYFDNTFIVARFVRITVFGAHSYTGSWLAINEVELYGVESNTTSAVAVTGVTLTPTNLNITEGQSSVLEETVSPADATDKSVSWSSSDTSVVTVDATGQVTAVSEGNATITVTTTDGSHTADCAVVVNASAPTNGFTETVGSETATSIAGYTGWDNASPIQFSGYNTSPGVNEVTNLNPSNTYAGASGGSNVEIKPGYTESAWFLIEGINTSNLSNNTLSFGMYFSSIVVTTYFEVSVSTDGTNWTILPNGTFPATATWGLMTYNNIPSASNLRIKFELSTRKTVNIDDIKVEGIGIAVNNSPTIDPVSDMSVFDNAGQQVINLSGISDGDGNTQIVSVTASSSNSTVANNVSVNYTSGNITGTLTLSPVSAGTATITVTVIDDGGNANGGNDTKVINFDITVIQSVVNVTAVSLTPTTLALEQGETSNLTETVAPVDATDKSVTWLSSDEAVATVDTNGLVTAVSEGNATITVITTDGSYTADCAVSVTLPPVQGFIETVGFGTASTIAAYTGWDNVSPILFSGYNTSPGVNVVTTLNPSNTYAGASGGSNVEIKPGYTETAWFLIEGINTSGFFNGILNFGMSFSSIVVTTNFEVSVSTDGTNWTVLPNGTFPTTGTWGLMTYGNIPAASNLRIKIEVTTRKTVNIDDITVVEGGAKSATVASRISSDSFINEQRISIHPNPVKGDDFIVYFKGYKTNDKVSIKIFDITGKKVYQSGTIQIASDKQFVLPHRDIIESGVYILRVNSSNSNIQQKFIVE